MRSVPLAAIGAGIVARLMAHRSDFSPQTKVVALDNFWHLQTSEAQLLARMPMQIVRFHSYVGNPGRNKQLTQAIRFQVRSFFQISDSAGPETQTMNNGQALAQIFTSSGENFDEWAELSLPNGCNLEEYYPEQLSPVDEAYAQNGIAGVEMILHVKVSMVDSSLFR